MYIQRVSGEKIKRLSEFLKILGKNFKKRGQSIKLKKGVRA